MMIKWKLMLTTLPFVFVILLCTFIRVEVLGLSSLLEFSDTAPVITATALALGFMLAGVMSDYKEGEKLPGEMACTLQAIDDCILTSAHQLAKEDFVVLKQVNIRLHTAIMNWLFQRESIENCYLALNQILALPKDCPGFQSSVIKHIDSLRRNITRLDVIRRTSFIQTGYALLEVFVSTALGLLVFANFKSMVAEYVVIAAISLIYIYMIRLIRDLDNPFNYNPDGSLSGVAEVDYFPLMEAQKRLELMNNLSSG